MKSRTGVARRLINKTRGVEIAHTIHTAASFAERAKGLLGENHLPQGTGLWIKGTRLVACNSIHTFFMRFAIDAVFVDDNLIVRSRYFNLGPWRITWPTANATSVFELPAGTLKEKPTEIGDQLYVGD
jgi:uncharacterized membrane protein (UPF0127 family)